MVTIQELDRLSSTPDNSADRVHNHRDINSASVNNDRSAPSSTTITSRNNNKTKTDKLAFIRPIIASQLPALQKVIEEFASSMLAKQSAVKTRIASLSKFETTYNDKPFLPKCLNLKVTLTTSKGLADDASTHTLQRELQEHVATFQRNATATLKRQAEAELKFVKNELVQNFIKFGLDLTKLYIACQEHRQNEPLDTDLGKHHLAITGFFFDT